MGGIVGMILGLMGEGTFLVGLGTMVVSIFVMPLSIYAIDNLTNNKGMGNAYKTVDRAYKFQDLSDDSPFKKFFAQHRTLRLDSAIGNVKDKVMNKAAELGIYTTNYEKFNDNNKSRQFRHRKFTYFLFVYKKTTNQ